jgi:2-polyprenyl-3-methyl-5-hydroxy-6-metoxy-1,4-benzoquinol methylase
MFKNITAVDPTSESCSICRKQWEGLANIQLHQLPAEQIDQLNGPFDAITCLDVIEHLDDPAIVLPKLYSLLKPGGQLIITVPNWYNFFYAKAIRDPYHKQFHSSYGWARLIERHGFIARNIRSVGFPILDFDILSRQMHLFGMCILIEATRPD